MPKLIVFKKICYELSKTEQKYHQGFTLIELIAVIAMVAVLATISIPSWLGFVARQRVNKANDTILESLQDAQREAKKQKLSYSVSFRKNNSVFEYAIHRTKKQDGTDGGKDLDVNEINNWKLLAQEVGVKSQQLILGTNLSKVENSVNSDIPVVSYNFINPVRVTFDYTGNPLNPNLGKPAIGSTEAPGIKIVVASVNVVRPNEPGSVKRCVIMQTLLGSLRTAKDADCN
jgi:prepilin-type N-terminal cleavage/methylation domain-containing protein